MADQHRAGCAPGSTLAVEGAAGGGRTTGVLPALIAGCVTFVAYLPGLGRSLDFDSAETVGLFVRPGPPWAAFQHQAVFNNHPMFSFLEQLVRVLTGRTDAATMRLLPIAFGALAVGVLTWFAARRHGLLAGLVAGAVLGCNPTFAGLSRSVRGYSLLTLCAIVSTIIVLLDDGRRSRRGGIVYVLVTAIGLATHLYMVPVVAGHVGVIVARRRLDEGWRFRFLAVLLLSALAYVGMAETTAAPAAGHSRTFQVDMPWRVAHMATGGGWASVALAPLVVLGAVLTLRKRDARDARAARAVRAGAVALGVVLLFLWAVLQSSALGERFFVWLVPVAGYLAAVAVGRIPRTVVPAVGSAALAVVALLPAYTSDPTAYRQAAAVIQDVNASDRRSCVVGVGVPPMLAYLDSPRDFAAVTDPAELDGCDVVVVTAWWDSAAPWLAADLRVVSAAERRFPHRLVLAARDPALVLSTRPLPAPAPPSLTGDQLRARTGARNWPV